MFRAFDIWPIVTVLRGQPCATQAGLADVLRALLLQRTRKVKKFFLISPGNRTYDTKMDLIYAGLVANGPRSELKKRFLSTEGINICYLIASAVYSAYCVASCAVARR